MTEAQVVQQDEQIARRKTPGPRTPSNSTILAQHDNEQRVNALLLPAGEQHDWRRRLTAVTSKRKSFCLISLLLATPASKLVNTNHCGHLTHQADVQEAIVHVP